MNKDGHLIVFADCDGKIVSFNSECERVTGFSEKEMIGRSLVETLVPPDWRNLVLGRFRAASAFDVRNPHCNPWITRDGTQRMIEWSCTFVPGDDGPLVLGRGRVCENVRRVNVSWEKIRMISFDENTITLLVDDDPDPKIYHFATRVDLEEQLRRWFGSAS
jgi:PAS domain S-box-containing protein